MGKLIDAGKSPTYRLLVGIPMTGLLRSEWVIARYGQTLPANWSHHEAVMWLDQYSPLRFSVADARNLTVGQAVTGGFEWLLFIDHDTILPPGALLRLNEYMLAGEPPIVGGLYFTKAEVSEPLVYRGRGNSYYKDWKMGDKIWVDGLGMGCTLIHTSILKVMWEESETYICRGIPTKKVFETPRGQDFNKEVNGWEMNTGTEDLFFLDRVIKENVLEKAGWPKYAKKKYPFLVDTGIFCTHIDWEGVQYPANGEEKRFIKSGDEQRYGWRIGRNYGPYSGTYRLDKLCM